VVFHSFRPAGLVAGREQAAPAPDDFFVGPAGRGFAVKTQTGSKGQPITPPK
jgi:hypothetical protein